MEERESFSPMGLIREVLSSYRENISSIYKICIPLCLIWGIGYLVFSWLYPKFMMGCLMSGLYSLVKYSIYLVVAIIILLGIKTLLIITVGLNQILEGRELTLSQANNETKGLYGSYFAGNIVIGISFYIPVHIFNNIMAKVIFSSIQFGDMKAMMKWTIIVSVIIILYYTLLKAFIGLAPTVAAIRWRERNYMDYTCRLVKGNVLKLFVVFMLFSIFNYGGKVLIGKLITNAYASYAVLCIFALIMLPLTQLVPIIAIRNLEKCAGIEYNNQKENK